MKMFRKDEGFSLVELMVVVLIMGILVAIAVPVFMNASANAKTKSCQTNQRTIVGAIQTFNASAQDSALTTLTAGEVLGATTGSTNVNQLIPGYIKVAPKCPGTNQLYLIGTDLVVTGDNGSTAGFAPQGTAAGDHKLQ